MPALAKFREAVFQKQSGNKFYRDYYLAKGYRSAFTKANVLTRAYGVEALFTEHEKYIYPRDKIAGSLRGLFGDDIANPDLDEARDLVQNFGERNFLTNADHYAPDYETILKLGIPGFIDKINNSLDKHKGDVKKTAFLQAALICMGAFKGMVSQYADAAEVSQAKEAPLIAKTCRALTEREPQTFREALQLVWLAHLSFVCQGRYAMALGRLDQDLYPFYKKDISSGILDREEAVSLLAFTFMKIGEHRLLGNDDVVNICIGGVLRDGSSGLNNLSFDILEAVKRCNIPGPNLSARLYKGISDDFIDACLQVIGTGLGYPALMNDEVNIPSLYRHGYTLEDSRDYCMVGCIENFIRGKQPPWSDGRFNVPKYLELAINDGLCMLTEVRQGPKTGPAGDISDIEGFMNVLKKQISAGADEYMARFYNTNNKLNKEKFMQPYLSCYCRDCIDKGLDINDGGAVYPSAHGACGMGIATVADSLAAIEKIVFEDKKVSLAGLRDALKANFEGYENLQKALLDAPKYGNDDDRADKYAVWYVDYLYEVFSAFRTPDGGAIYTAIASNTANVPAGKLVAATPDGRRAKMPLSDAASPMYGKDINGPTAVVNSISKPDYTKVSTGTVLNQKYSPDMFTNPEKRKKLLSLIKVYFAKGGQEIQMNAVSRSVLKDALENPENYASLVVRVSGFSAFYVNLEPEVQKDILNRTEHG